MNLVVTSTLTQLILLGNLCPIFMSNMARTKQTARRSTGTIPPNHSQPLDPEPRRCIQASSYDPPIIDTRQSAAVESMLAQFAEDDLTRDAVYRYEDLIEPTLTGRISRKRRDDLIAECRAQILAERAAADAAAALLSLGPVQANVQAEPQAQADPATPITGNKRNRSHLKSKGSILHNPARG